MRSPAERMSDWLSASRSGADDVAPKDAGQTVGPDTFFIRSGRKDDAGHAVSGHRRGRDGKDARFANAVVSKRHASATVDAEIGEWGNAGIGSFGPMIGGWAFKVSIGMPESRLSWSARSARAVPK